MSLWYRLLYQMGFTPWEQSASQEPVTEQFERLIAREESEPPGAPRTALDLGCGSGIWSVLLARRGDLECFNHLSETQRRCVGREIDSVAARDATFLVLAWTPGRRGPLPSGASRQELESALPGWAVTDAEPYPVEALPAPLRKVEPYFYRLRRVSAS